MVKRIFVSIFVTLCASLSVFSQDNDSLLFVQEPRDSLIVDSLKFEEGIKTNIVLTNTDKLAKDTVVWAGDKVVLDKSTEKMLTKDNFKPDPTKAVIYSAIFPGLGQIYNRKYWKLPIVYGGAIGLIYAITWNGRMYSDYTSAYIAIMSSDRPLDRKDEFMHVFPSTVEDPSKWSDTQWGIAKNSIRRRRDFNRRNRDLSIIGAVGLYVLCMIDSYVDAHLYDFNMSPDLSFRVEPTIGLDNFSQLSVGLQCSVKF